MIIFHNPGHIDWAALRLMGVSVKQEGSFGRFGTGFKYALATILRGGGSLTIYSGGIRVTFETESITVRGREFQEVVLVSHYRRSKPARHRIGFTTELGKDWEPWMAARELGCNARDEGGNWTIWDDPNTTWGPCGLDDQSEITVNWPEMEEALTSNAAHVFVPDVPTLGEGHGVRVLPGPSQYLYHRGVRVWKLPKPSAFTYDIMSPVELTEDRTVKYGFCVVADVRNMLLQSTDQGIIGGTVVGVKDLWEGSFDWTGAQWEPRSPGQDWLETVASLRELKQPVAKSAVDVMLAHTAMRKAESFYSGSTDVGSGVVSDLVEDIAETGLDLSDTKMYVVDELMGGALTLTRNGAIYIGKNTLTRSNYVIARELIKRHLEIQSGGEHDKLLSIVVPLVVGMCDGVMSTKEDNDDKVASEQDGEADSETAF